MTQTGFIAAMAADLAFAAYDAPAAVDRRESEWVIVSVWGMNREFLTLSRTGVAVVSDDAPPGLQPFGTHLGVLLNRVVTGTEEASEYLLMRNQPADIPVGGMFFPTDGFIRLTLNDGTHTLAGSCIAGPSLPGIGRAGAGLTGSSLTGSSLTGHGRFARCAGTLHGRHVMLDVPAPPPGAATGAASDAMDARAWHMTASRRPWIGEFVPPEGGLLRSVSAKRPAPPPSRRPRPVMAIPSQDKARPAPSLPDHAAQSDHRSPESAHLAPVGPAPHTRRRKRPEAKHGVTTEA